MDAGPLSVLIVDDDHNIARMLHYALCHYGAQPTVVHTGGDALHHLARTASAVLLTDYHLPDMTGGTLIAQVRQQIQPPPCVILMSGESQDTLAVCRDMMGLSTYLAKPFSIPALYQALNQCRLEAARNDEDSRSMTPVPPIVSQGGEEQTGKYR